MSKYNITFRIPGIFTILGVIFIVLKLIGTINWSWWLILLPIYGPICIILFWVLVFILIWYNTY